MNHPKLPSNPVFWSPSFSRSFRKDVTYLKKNVHPHKYRGIKNKPFSRSLRYPFPLILNLESCYEGHDHKVWPACGRCSHRQDMKWKSVFSRFIPSVLFVFFVLPQGVCEEEDIVCFSVQNGTH